MARLLPYSTRTVPHLYGKASANTIPPGFCFYIMLVRKGGEEFMMYFSVGYGIPGIADMPAKYGRASAVVRQCPSTAPSIKFPYRCSSLHHKDNTHPQQ